ncbi:ap-3 complex subunit delta-1 [Anaeramoeba ignava]|uniref:AP-3 complex subunit delta n=1 Tax=Anaeramoeba ignava TaxID=1746090 RepID=A0A9Q0LEX3_ANAIG|nr:ap-3 complex subunit delta-1 [Anaeramoeba ignava]
MVKSLQDIVRGIRNNKKSETQYISTILAEIKEELKSSKIDVKTAAIQKLLYLQLFGEKIEWASFYVVEVMSSSQFGQKRIGYAAAGQSFRSETEVIVLLTNLFKKDFSSQNFYDAALALNCFSCIGTVDLARNLVSDVVTMTTSSKPYIRKRAILTLYKIFVKYPDALRPVFPRLRERLDDEDISVQGAAINVVCELAKSNPKNFLALAPPLYRKLQGSCSNWMLIKIVKLMGLLTPTEPRLAKKLVEPMTTILSNVSSPSVIYETVNTVITGMHQYAAPVQLCVEKLRNFVESNDRNLKYLGLTGFTRLVQHHPKLISGNKDIVIICLEDQDIMIRLRALELLTSMATRRNLVDIIRKLLEHLENAEGTYGDDLINRILEIGHKQNYELIRDFEWFFNVLMKLTIRKGTTVGEKIASEIMNVMIRVKAIREYGVKCLLSLINDNRLISENANDSMIEVLYAAAWCLGEFSDFLSDTGAKTALESLLQNRITSLPSTIQAIFIQNAMKLYIRIAASNSDKMEETDKIILEKLPLFTQSVHLEVQERACGCLAVIKLIQKIRKEEADIASEFKKIFTEELNPVAPRAQRKVPIPQGLDLDAWINEPPKEESDHEDDYDEDDFFGEKKEKKEKKPKLSKKERRKLKKEEKERQKREREEREEQRRNNPFYLKTGKATLFGSTSQSESKEVEEIPIENVGVLGIDLGNLSIEPKKESKSRRSRHRRSKHRKAEESEDEKVEIKTVLEMPDGAEESEDSGEEKNSELAALGKIDLTKPQEFSEALPTIKTYQETEKERLEQRKKSRRNQENQKEIISINIIITITIITRNQKINQKTNQKINQKINQKEELMMKKIINTSIDPIITNISMMSIRIKTDSKKPTPKKSTSKNEPQLIDFDLIQSPVPQSRITKSPDQKTKKAPTKSQDPFDFLELLSTPKKSEQKAQPKEVIKSNDNLQNIIKSDSKSGLDSDSKSSRHHSKQDKKDHDHKHKKDKDDEKDKDRKHHHHHHHKSEKDSKDSKDSKDNFEIFLKERDLIAECIKVVDPKKPTTLQTKIKVTSKKKQISRLVLQVIKSEAVSLEKANEKNEIAGERDSDQMNLAFKFKETNINQKVEGILKYKFKGKKEKPNEVNFKIPIFATDFVVQTKISKEELGALLSGNSCTKTSSTTLSKVDSLSFSDIIQKIVKGTNAFVMESSDSVASLYSKTSLNLHAVMIVRLKKPQVTIDLRASDQKLADSIISRIKELF